MQVPKFHVHNKNSSEINFAKRYSNLKNGDMNLLATSPKCLATRLVPIAEKKIYFFTV